MTGERIESSVLPQAFEFADPLGSIGGYQLTGPVYTAGNAFFESLGTNGRAAPARSRVTATTRARFHCC